MPRKTENYIRLDVPGEAGKHEGHDLRTKTLSKKEGIKALYCLQCKKLTTYLFNRNPPWKWTMSRAQDWVEKHKKISFADLSGDDEPIFEHFDEKGNWIETIGKKQLIREVEEKSLVDINKEFDNDRVIFLFSNISDFLAEDICKKLLFYDKLDKKKPVKIFISSYGGSVYSSFAIIDMMEYIQCPIEIIGIGKIMSGGLLIFMAGDKRYISQSASILSHRFSTMKIGTQAQLKADQREDDLVHQRMIDHYKKFTNLKTDKEVLNKLLKETNVWLTPEEAMGYGLADEYLDKDWEGEEGEGEGADQAATTYTCSCIKCGYTMTSTKHCNTLCLSDTVKILLLDGRSLTIPEIMTELKQDKNLWTYSSKQDGKFVPQKITKAQKTKFDRMLRVTLDNDKSFECTYEHPVMMRNGKFKRADKLKIKDSVMPFNTMVSEKTGKSHVGGYRFFWDLIGNKWRPVHLWVVKELGLHHLWSGVTHHKDFNKLNNNPDNLPEMTHKKHKEMHVEHLMRLREDPEWVKRNREALYTPEAIAKRVESQKKWWKSKEGREAKKVVAKRAKKLWKDENYRLKMSISSSAFIKKLNADPTKALLKQRINFVELGQEWLQNNGEKISVWAKKSMNKIVEKRCPICGKWFEGKNASFAAHVGHCRRTAGLSPKIERDRDSKGKFLGKEDSVLVNHRIKSIEKIEAKQGYDISVDGEPNFAINAGVFVHNSCPKCGGQMRRRSRPGPGQESVFGENYKYKLGGYGDIFEETLTEEYSTPQSEFGYFPSVSRLSEIYFLLDSKLTELLPEGIGIEVLQKIKGILKHWAGQEFPVPRDYWLPDEEDDAADLKEMNNALDQLIGSDDFADYKDVLQEIKAILARIIQGDFSYPRVYSTLEEAKNMDLNEDFITEPVSIDWIEEDASKPFRFRGKAVKINRRNKNNRRYRREITERALREARRLGGRGKVFTIMDGHPKKNDTAVTPVVGKVVFGDIDVNGWMPYEGQISNTSRGMDIQKLLRDKCIGDVSLRSKGRTAIAKMNGESIEDVVDLHFKGLDMVTEGAEEGSGVEEIFNSYILESYWEGPDLLESIGGYRALPLDPSGAWDGTAAVRRMRNFVGGPDKAKMNWSKYQKGFVWYDMADKENFGSYKLPFADIVKGKLMAVWGGVNAGMAAVNGARTPLKMSPTEKKSAYNFLVGYYKKFDKTPPAFKGELNGGEFDMGTTIEELKKDRPDLVEAIRGEEKDKLNKEIETLKKELKETQVKDSKIEEFETIKKLNERIINLETEKALRESKEVFNAKIKESNLTDELAKGLEDQCLGKKSEDMDKLIEARIELVNKIKKAEPIGISSRKEGLTEEEKKKEGEADQDEVLKAFGGKRKE